jgi:superkiller protein 3
MALQCPVDQAIWLAQQGELDAALVSLDIAIRHGHDVARAWYQRGLTLVALGRKDDALHAYRQALELRPSYLQPLVNLASLYLERGDTSVAGALMARAAPLAGADDPIFLCQRAKLRRMTGDVRGAIADATHATRAAPTLAPAWTELGLCLLMAPDAAAVSAEASRRALAIDPDAAHAAHNLAVALDRLGEAEEAHAHASAALAAQPDNATFQQTAACVLLHLRRAGDAMPLLRAVAAARPDSFEAHYNLACGLAQTGAGDEAAPHVRRALALVPASHRDAFRAHVPRDPDLAAARGHASFRALLVDEGLA